MYYDGATLAVYDAGAAVYAQAPTDATLDGAVAHYIRGLRMRLPMAVLLVSSIDKELERRVTELDYVELSTLCAQPCHHVAGRTDTTDVQVWIADGAQPVPLRVVITYREEPGQPQYRAELSDWNFAPKADDAMFAFTPPAGAQKIPFAVDVTPLAHPRRRQDRRTAMKTTSSRWALALGMALAMLAGVVVSTDVLAQRGRAAAARRRMPPATSSAAAPRRVAACPRAPVRSRAASAPVRSRPRAAASARARRRPARASAARRRARRTRAPVPTDPARPRAPAVTAPRHSRLAATSRAETQQATSANRSEAQQTRSTSASESQQTRSTNRSETAQSGQQTRSENVSSRQETAQSGQQTRSETVQSGQQTRSQTAQSLEGEWDDCCDYYWNDEGAAFVAGATVGAMTTAAVASTTYPTSTTTTTTTTAPPPPSYVSALPCAATATVVSGATYYRCGSTWYQQAFASGQTVYVIVAPPPGY